AKLLVMFESRRCRSPLELVDATLDRAAHKIQDLAERNEAIRDPEHYIYGVARNIVKEFAVGPRSKEIGLTADRDPVDDTRSDEIADREEMHQALERCLERLSPDKRGVIERYYYGQGRAKKEARERLAAELGVTMGALYVVTCRIRGDLRDCVEREINPGIL